MASTQVEVIVRLGPDTIQRRLINPGEYLIGCDPSCQLHLEDNSASHKHARLFFDGERFVVEDLGSTNGTFLDGVRLTRRVPIRLGQQLQIGQSLLELAPLSDDHPARAASAGLDAPDSPGNKLMARHHYQTGREVARGGMGAVHEAQDLSLRRSVALKVLLAGNQATREAALRFEREARVLARLEHPNIVPIHDLGMDEQGQVFYTMKLVKGVTLKQVLEEIKAANAKTIAKYPLTNLLTMFQKVCDAVSFAHSKGVIHRDLKPANIMLGEFGEVLVMDWGLAKLIHPASSSTGLASGFEVGDIETLREDDQPDQDFRPVPMTYGTDAIHTLEGSIMGSPQFMAPEQAEGRISDIGERSDIYALGGILYNILTLSPPVTGGSSHEILEKIREGQITPPSSTYNRTVSPPARSGAPTAPQPIVLVHCPGRRIPEALSAVTMKALALRPENRYQTVAELQKDIAAYQGGFATSAEQAGAWKLLSLAIKRRRTEFSLAAAGLLIIGVLAASFMWKVTSTLGELRRTAPTFHHQALALIEEQKFDDALQRISYALTLAPKESEFHVLKGNLLQSLLNLPEARDAYAQALRFKPNHEQAQASRQLTAELLAKHQGNQALRPEDLEQLRALMLAQGRSAEALAMAQRMARQTQDTVAYWQGVLDKAGWKGTLSKDENNRLRFQSSPDNSASDLSPFRGMPLSQLVIVGGKVSDLGPLKGMLLDTFHVDNGELIKDLEPLRGMPLVNFFLGNGAITDVSPLKGMPLRDLQIPSCTNLTDLRPLKGMRIEQLSFYTTYVSDLNPLQGMPLTHFDIVTGPNITDISPLRGMPLTWLRLGCPKLTDISPLQGMPLTCLIISSAPISDLSALRGMKLTDLALNQAKTTDFSPIKGMPISNLILAETTFSDMSLLQDMPLTSLNLFRTRVTDLSVLHGMRLEDLNLYETKVRDLTPLAGMPLRSLQASFTAISDISPLKGAPLKELYLGNTAVADISAVRGAPLTDLDLTSTPVRDVSAVQGAPLANLYLQNSSVADISGLLDAPMKVLLMHNCRRLLDLSPLAECRQLEYLTLPPQHKDVEFLRSLPNLKRLGYTLPPGGWEVVPTPAGFWKAYDARKR